MVGTGSTQDRRRRFQDRVKMAPHRGFVRERAGARPKPGARARWRSRYLLFSDGAVGKPSARGRRAECSHRDRRGDRLRDQMEPDTRPVDLAAVEPEQHSLDPSTITDPSAGEPDAKFWARPAVTTSPSETWSRPSGPKMSVPPSCPWSGPAASSAIAVGIAHVEAQQRIGIEYARRDAAHVAVFLEHEPVVCAQERHRHRLGETGCDVVFHLAARVDFDGTASMLRAAHAVGGVLRFIVTSSTGWVAKPDSRPRCVADLQYRRAESGSLALHRCRDHLRPRAAARGGAFDLRRRRTAARLRASGRCRARCPRQHDLGAFWARPVTSATRSIADIGKALRLLGYRPVHLFASLIGEVVAEIRAAAQSS